MYVINVSVFLSGGKAIADISWVQLLKEETLFIIHSRAVPYFNNHDMLCNSDCRTKKKNKKPLLCGTKTKTDCSLQSSEPLNLTKLAPQKMLHHLKTGKLLICIHQEEQRGLQHQTMRQKWGEGHVNKHRHQQYHRHDEQQTPAQICTTIPTTETVSIYTI